MKDQDLNSLKRAWDKSAIDNPKLAALSIIPTGVREDMISCLVNVSTSIDYNKINLSGEYSLFLKLLTLIVDFYKIIEKTDPLDFAKSEYDRLYGKGFPEWYTSPIIDPVEYINGEKKTDEGILIFERSEYFNHFLEAIKASVADGNVIRQFLLALGESNISDFPTKLPDCFLGAEVGRLFVIYGCAAQAEWLQIQAVEQENECFKQNTFLTIQSHKAITGKYRDIITEWEWYWKDKHQDIFNIASNMLMWKDIEIDPMDNEHREKSYEFFLTAILYWDIILRNWPDYIFSYLLPETIKDVYMQMKFSRFLMLHSSGDAFKTVYAKYCSERGIIPLIYVKHQLEIDSKGQDKLWISPSFKDLDKKIPEERYNIICHLFDLLYEWGAFGEDVDTFSLKTLFAYRFSGVMPMRDIQEKLPWAKSKTELALLIHVLVEGGEGRRPYKFVNSFFDMNLSNITEMVKRADDKPIRTLILQAFEQG